MGGKIAPVAVFAIENFGKEMFLKNKQTKKKRRRRRLLADKVLIIGFLSDTHADSGETTVYREVCINLGWENDGISGIF